MIRLATSRDAPGVHAIYAPIVRDTFISFELEAPPVAEIERRIAATLGKYPWLVFEDGGSVAGYAYAGEHRERAAYQWSTDVSCYVHERARRRGIGARLYRALFRLLARQGFTNAFAGIALPNDASVGMHEAVGFVALGRYRDVGFKRGEWHDTVWMQRKLADPASPPEPPRPLAALSPREVEEALGA
ncbi:MAG TPA: arsinothricin resistance N-acetyltransferase ArsN1 family B [Usitatibacter sp.]|nr:arsinothricin resistance N-acetyltransferase ArsN1 family B [Usitatibacter sp.]